MSDDKLIWEKLASRRGPEMPLFGVRFDRLRHPQTSTEFERLVLESPAWINVVAVTSAGEIVMVEQFRFGVGKLTLEPVGGIVDAGEDSLAAARRELLEESGYAILWVCRPCLACFRCGSCLTSRPRHPTTYKTSSLRQQATSLWPTLRSDCASIVQRSSANVQRG